LLTCRYAAIIAYTRIASSLFIIFFMYYTKKLVQAIQEVINAQGKSYYQTAEECDLKWSTFHALFRDPEREPRFETAARLMRWLADQDPVAAARLWGDIRAGED
jgi:hypothetical protein